MLSKAPIATPAPQPEIPVERPAHSAVQPSAVQPAAVPQTSVSDKSREKPTAATSESSSPAKGGWGGVLGLVIVVIACGAGWYFRAQLQHLLGQFLPAKPAETRKAGPRSIPVVTADVKQRDLEVFLNGLGTVTALQTVTIRSRVEGELTKIAFEEGQMVEAGALLAEIDPRPFEVQRDQAVGQLARDQATLETAQVTLERLEKLLPSKSVTPQEIDNQVSLVRQSQGTIKADEAAVADAELQLTYCKITAPFRGRIGLRLVDRGNIVRANDPTGIAVITQVEPIAVVFTIPQDDIHRVQKQMRTGKPLKVEAFDRDFQTRLATGKLLATDNQVDPATGTLRLKAIFEYGDNALFPNQFVNTRLLIDTRERALMIPTSAIQRDTQTTFVYVATADEKAEKRKIAIGPAEGTETSVESGLRLGELVVTDGLDKLSSGAAITLREAAPKKPDAAAAGKPDQAEAGHEARQANVKKEPR